MSSPQHWFRVLHGLRVANYQTRRRSDCQFATGAFLTNTLVRRSFGAPGFDAEDIDTGASHTHPGAHVGMATRVRHNKHCIHRDDPCATSLGQQSFPHASLLSVRARRLPSTCLCCLRIGGARAHRIIRVAPSRPLQSPTHAPSRPNARLRACWAFHLETHVGPNLAPRWELITSRLSRSLQAFSGDCRGGRLTPYRWRRTPDVNG